MLSFLLKDATAKVAREHVKVVLMLPRRFLASLRKRKEKKRERERDVCSVCPTFENLCERILAERPKIDIFWFKIQRSIFGLFSGGVTSLTTHASSCFLR